MQSESANKSNFPTRVPTATYRFQFHKGFPLAQALKDNLVEYMHELGVSDCYSSPLLKSRPGSTHGYDVVDHSTFNPEILSPSEFETFSNALMSKKMGLLLDIVPNHVGICDSGNRWWMDVLENGRSSIYSNYLDIDWNKSTSEGKMLVPFLGSPIGKVIEEAQLQIVYRPEKQLFFIKYWDNEYPTSPSTWPMILRKVIETNIADKSSLEAIIKEFEGLPNHNVTEEKSKTERNEKSKQLKEKFASLYEKKEDIKKSVEEILKKMNGVKDQVESFSELENFINAQPYRLSYWKRASDEINYRRFFDINELMSICMERSEVFDEVHKLLLPLIKEGRITGLRIDHPDGLYDPVGYFSNLQKAAQKTLGITPDQNKAPLYVLIEKILEHGEYLNLDWAVHGTTGYDFMNVLNGVFVDRNNEKEIREIYTELTGTKSGEGQFDNLLQDCKKFNLENSLESELTALANVLLIVANQNRLTKDFTLKQLKKALSYVIACFPVYRTFITPETLDTISEVDKKYITMAITDARRKDPSVDPLLYDFIEDLLLNKNTANLYTKESRIKFIMKIQQLTGPVMAKGLEDTTFYRYFLLTSLNEVGGHPDLFGIDSNDFHHENAKRNSEFPHTMLSTSTHDTKRSEDVRSRLNVLSEIPSEWKNYVNKFFKLNEKFKSEVDCNGIKCKVPATNEEYLIYQTLVGVWPFNATSCDKELEERIVNYIIKASKEAKVYTSWVVPNAKYEESLVNFVKNILQNQEFLSEFLTLEKKVSHFGKLNSLSQTVLKLTVPGVPDVYQGMEFFNFSLVDPDNRRPVDYQERKNALEVIRSEKNQNAEFVGSLMKESDNGHIKMLITHKLLTFRRDHAALFQSGSYTALTVKGDKSNNVIAFVRENDKEKVVIVVGRFFTQLVNESWSNTSIDLGRESQFVNLFTGETVKQEKDFVTLDKLFNVMPFAVLSSTSNERK